MFCCACLASAAAPVISEDSLRGHVSFLASDALEGRATPSRGQEIAAEYIAAQFRRAGLEPAGDDGYFQTANWILSGGTRTDFKMSIKAGEQQITPSINQASFNFNQGLTLEQTTVIKVPDAATLEGLTPENVQGKVVWSEVSAARAIVGSTALQALKPALIVFLNRTAPNVAGPGPVRLVDPERQVRPTDAVA